MSKIPLSKRKVKSSKKVKLTLKSASKEVGFDLEEIPWPDVPIFESMLPPEIFKLLSQEKSKEIPKLKLTTQDKSLLSKHRKLKLQIELVPRSSWWRNLRLLLSRKDWDALRKKIYKKAKFVCEICGKTGEKKRIECHEVWRFNEKDSLQKLVKFQALCPLCHEVKHMGLANIRGYGERAFNRFKRINRITKKEADQICNAVFDRWSIHSRISWKIEIGLLDKYGIESKSYARKVKKAMHEKRAIRLF